MTRQSALFLSLSLSLLVSCTNGGSSGTPGTGQLPGASPGSGTNGANGSTPGSAPTVTPAGSTGSNGTASPTPSPGGTGNGSNGSSLVQRLEIRLPSRFLSFRGETVKLEVKAFDATGNPVDPGSLSFMSSRPEVISVDATGLVRALVENGFAEIRVTAGGQTVTQLISVATGIGGAGGGGGGSGGASLPTREEVMGNVGLGFIAAPQLTGLSVGEGPVGSLLTITGSGFRTSAGDDTVVIGGVVATIIGTPTADSMTVQVPAGDLGSQSVRVTVGGQTSNALSFRRVRGELRANSFTASSQGLPVIAMDADGDFVVAWQSYGQDASSEGIYAQRYDATGAPQGNEFRVNVTTASAQGAPAIAISDNGDFVIAWKNTSPNLSSDDIRARRYSAAGVAQSGEISVNAYTTDSQSLPAIAMDDEGDFVIAWQSQNQDGSGRGIYAQRFDASGAPQGLEFRVNTFTTDDQVEPTVAMDADGDFVISWSSANQDSSSYGIYAQRYDAAGAAQGNEFRVNAYTPGSQSQAAVAMDTAGDFVIAWTAPDPFNFSSNIYAQRFTATGVPQGNLFQVNTFTTGRQDTPSLAMDADGDFVIAWNSYDQDGSSNGMFAQRYSSAGVIQGNEFQVNLYTTSLQQGFAIAMDDSGNFGITWESANQDGDNTGSYFRLFDAEGAGQ